MIAFMFNCLVFFAFLWLACVIGSGLFVGIVALFSSVHESMADAIRASRGEAVEKPKPHYSWGE